MITQKPFGIEGLAPGILLRLEEKQQDLSAVAFTLEELKSGFSKERSNSGTVRFLSFE